MNSAIAYVLLPLTVIQAAKSGDENSIVHILDSTRPICISAFKKMRVRSSDLDDVAQEAVLVTLNCIQRYDTFLGNFEELLSTSIYNMLGSYYRKKEHRSLDSIPEPNSWGSFEHIECMDALEHLDQTKQILIKEHYGIGCRDLSLKELAVRHNMSTETVKKELTESFDVMRGVLG
jgi:RNA polymerase sigma factor (sigma-70 family)